MDYAFPLFLRILGVFAVMAAGWLARRTRIMTEAAITACSRLVVEVSLPCLIYARILQTIRRDEILGWWPVPLAGLAMPILAGLAARPLLPRTLDASRRATAAFMARFPNWFYLPLAVLVPVFPDTALRILLILNIGVHAYLWTVGIRPLQALRAGPTGWRGIGKAILANPALLATAAGLATVALWPASTGLTAVDPAVFPMGPACLAAILEAMSTLGDVAVPLNLLLVGAQLAAMPPIPEGGKRLLLRVLALRLAVAPAVFGLALALAVKSGLPMDRDTFLVLFLVSAMPAAVVASLVTEVYGGDTPLAARGILATTAMSLATIPLWAVAGPHLYGWAA